MPKSSKSKSVVRTQRTPRRSNAPIRALWNYTSQSMPHVIRMRPQDNVIHRFIQQVDGGTVITSNVGAAVAAGVVFTLANIPNTGAYTSLFDQYRITRVEAWLQPQNQVLATSVGMLYSAVDYDNSPNLTVSGISQYSNVLQSPLAISGHYHSFNPHVAIAAYGGATFTSYANEQSPWIDCTSSGVPHYGLSLVTSTSSVAVNVDIIARYHVEFRNII